MDSSSIIYLVKKGDDMSRIIAFKGIRYATASRWEYPIEEPRWNRIENLDECLKNFQSFGACSYQPRAFVDESKIPEKQFYYREFREGVDFTYSEDCLFLNVYTSTDDNDNLYGQKKPVIVYIHGGSFSTGSSDEKVFDPTKWVEKGVVAVTINYRLGPFGFMCLPELASDKGRIGNFGLYDQLTALEWINHNIEIFGGDPGNVTLMGQSAGAMSVTHLILCPSTKGLFHKAVLSSGGGVSTFVAPKHPDQTYSFWRKIMDKCNVDNIEDFKKCDPKIMVESWIKVCLEVKNVGVLAGPVIDNVIVRKSRVDDYKSGNYNHVPIIIGSNSEDILTTVFFEMVSSWGKNMAAYSSEHKEDKNARAYTYHFCRQLPGDNKGAWHSSDLWYWFGSLDNCWREFTEVDRELSRQMIRYLTNFAKTSNPNMDYGADEESIVVWDSTTDALHRYMHFGDDGCHIQRVSVAKTVSTMLFRRR